jgi:hypothetical protein
MRINSLLLGCVVLVGACGGDDGGDPLDADLGDGAGGPDGATPDGGDPLDAAPTTGWGLVNLSENRQGDTTLSGAFALFRDDAPIATPTATAGECSYYASPQATRGLSAGAIAISGTTTPLAMTPEGTAPDVGYATSPSPPPTPLFTPGAAIEIDAAGADTPAFTATVTAPTPLAAYTPPSAFSRAAPPTLTWTAGAGDEIFVTMFLAPSFTSLRCVTADDGTFTFSAATIALIPGSETETFVTLTRLGTSEQTVDGFAMRAQLLAAVSTEGPISLTP